MEEKKAEAQVASCTQDLKGKGQGQMVLSSISHFPSRARAGLREPREEGLKLSQGRPPPAPQTFLEVTYGGGAFFFSPSQVPCV